MDGGAWWAAVLGVARSWTRLSDFTFTFHFDALEKEMATRLKLMLLIQSERSSISSNSFPSFTLPKTSPSLVCLSVGYITSSKACNLKT